jgi:antitoxin ParD1/3/4
VSVTLTPQLEALVRQKVETGPYGSAEEVIEEALQALEERERFQRLRASLMEAEAEIERGEGVEWTPELMEHLKREANELRRQGAEPDRDVCP